MALRDTSQELRREREYAEAYSKWVGGMSPEELERARELEVDGAASTSTRSAVTGRGAIVLEKAATPEPQATPAAPDGKMEVVLLAIRWMVEVENPKNRAARATAIGLMLGGPSLFNCTTKREVCARQGVSVRTINHNILALREWGRVASMDVPDVAGSEHDTESE